MNNKCFKLDKIVRDRVPQMFLEEDVKVILSEEIKNPLDNLKRKVEYLKRKLCEESNEVLHAKSHEEVIEEIADCMEVIETLCKVMNIKMSEIENIKKKKRDFKGGFDNCTIIEKIIMSSNNSVISYYLKDPSKYPQITE